MYNTRKRVSRRGGITNNPRYRFTQKDVKRKGIDPSLLVQKAATIEESPAYEPRYTFEGMGLHAQLTQNVLAKGYQQPTPIQDQVIPELLQRKDVIGLASTGTGKTAAFLLPLIHHVAQGTTKQVLIMAPTRELALQIHAEFASFAQSMRIFGSLCIGGANIKRQIQALDKRPHFVIGTPGRLIDLEKRGHLSFGDFDAIVLDEVDQMFDMGFIHDMRYVIGRLPEQRHSLFFSATLPEKMNGLVKQFLRYPVRVEVQKQRPSAQVEQDVVRLAGKSKISVLHDLLITKGFDKVLVFGRTKHGLNRLTRDLSERGFKVAAIHGNKSQAQRERALRAFKQEHVQVLLATDIASRGLDIDDVTHVINYDLPDSYEDYIHRIGRTGRANKTGVALSFVD